MKEINFTEFRKNASTIFSEVEKGEVVYVLRHGKTIAAINPVNDKSKVSSWKKPGIRLVTDGKSLTKAILEERLNQ